jgi:hypothetical protein
MEINFKPLIFTFQTYFIAIILLMNDVHYQTWTENIPEHLGL